MDAERSLTDLDQDAVIAAADLVRRSGAQEFEIGYVHEDVPVEEACWYAQATYKGARLIVENHRGPVEAAEALARRLMTGAKCAHCGGLVALSDRGAVVFERQQMADGTTWGPAQAAKAGQCRWRRVGDTWQRGCA